MQLEQSFEIAASVDAVWAAFGDLAATASCIPGAEIGAVKENRVAEGRFLVQLGPIKASFEGEAEVTRDDSNYSGTIVGMGRDRKNATRVRSTVDYKLMRVADATTRVDLAVDYGITGPLAQIAKASIVKDVAIGLIRIFAGNLERMLSAKATGAAPGLSPAAAAQSAAPPQSINLVSLVLSAIWRRIVAVVRGQKP